MSKYLAQGARRTWSHCYTVFPYDCSGAFCMIDRAHAKQNGFVNTMLYPKFICLYLKILKAKDYIKTVQ